jgi:hypothetical protein
MSNNLNIPPVPPSELPNSSTNESANDFVDESVNESTNDSANESTDDFVDEVIHHTGCKLANLIFQDKFVKKYSNNNIASVGAALNFNFTWDWDQYLKFYNAKNEFDKIFKLLPKRDYYVVPELDTLRNNFDIANQEYNRILTNNQILTNINPKTTKLTLALSTALSTKNTCENAYNSHKNLNKENYINLVTTLINIMTPMLNIYFTTTDISYKTYKNTLLVFNLCHGDGPHFSL